MIEYLGQGETGIFILAKILKRQRLPPAPRREDRARAYSRRTTTASDGTVPASPGMDT